VLTWTSMCEPAENGGSDLPSTLANSKLTMSSASLVFFSTLTVSVLMINRINGWGVASRTRRGPGTGNCRVHPLHADTAQDDVMLDLPAARVFHFWHGHTLHLDPTLILCDLLPLIPRSILRI